MAKYLLLFVLGCFLWWLWRKPKMPDASRPSASSQAPVERMVACAHCGVNQPLSECIQSGDRYFCSEAHRRDAETGKP